MLGLFAMGLSFMRGAALVTILAVLVVMAAASRSSRRCSATSAGTSTGCGCRSAAGSRPTRRGRRPRRAEPRLAGAGAGWSSGTGSSRPSSASRSLLALAAPFLGVRFGFPDAGNDRDGTSTRQAYDMLAEGFGPGANGPLLLAAELPARAATRLALEQRLAARCRSTAGVAAVTPAVGQPGR